MSTQRLEAFSDGVIAIVITITVLELKVPHEASWHALQRLLPVFLSYILSFVYVGIYWNNHHHLMQLAERVSAGMLWANLHLLFWMSLIPFVTGWAGENHFQPLPTAAYGVVLLMAGVAFYVLQKTILWHGDPEDKLAHALHGDWKSKASIALYLAGIGLSFVSAWIAVAVYVAVAAMWLIPSRRIEREVDEAEEAEPVR